MSVGLPPFCRVVCGGQVPSCDKEGHYSCTPDEKQIVRCVAKKYVADEKCKKNEKCAVKGELVGCY